MIGYETYPIPGFEPEWLLTLGTQTGRQILVLPPFLEEANFTRTFLVAFGRRLAEAECGVWLPDLPGCGESLRPLVEVTLADWRAAAVAAAEHIVRQTGRRPHLAAFRSGALLDDAVDAASRWRFAPASGADLLRHMRRAQLLAARESPPSAVGDGFVYLTGYVLSELLAEALQTAVPAESPAVRTLAWPSGSTPLWRRAEPADEAGLAAEQAADLLHWITACGG